MTENKLFRVYVRVDLKPDSSGCSRLYSHQFNVYAPNQNIARLKIGKRIYSEYGNMIDSYDVIWLDDFNTEDL